MVAAGGLPGQALDLARRLHAQGRLKDAAEAYRALLATAPDNPDALHLLGVIAYQQGQNDDALQLIDRAITLRPGFPEAHNNRGNVLKAMHRAEDAIDSYTRAIGLRPDYVLAHIHLGVLHWETNRFNDAEACCRRAIDIDPRSAAARTTLGTVLCSQRRYAEAAEQFEVSLRLEPNRAETHGGLGDIQAGTGHPEEALVLYARALELNPRHPGTHMNRGITLLAMGRLEEGWPDYEYRRRLGWLPLRHIDGEEWTGGSLAGKALLCYAEQGLGDTIQFIRFAAALAPRARRVVVEVQPALVPLLRSVAGIEVIGRGEPLPAVDLVAPLMSLPGLMRIGLGDLPLRTGYITPEPRRVARQKATLPSGGLRIGIVWQGSPGHRDYRRSLPLNSFAPLLDLPGVRLVSLQKGYGSEQLAAWPGGERIATLAAGFDEDGAFLDTAAAMCCLDLVISCDTATAHLAGALGAETWVLLQHHADWRWMADRADSPWYPSMRLFRQPHVGDWAGLMSDVAAALHGRLREAAA